MNTKVTIRDVAERAGASISSVHFALSGKAGVSDETRERIRLALYTPLEETFSFPFEKAVVFTGSADPWVGKEKSRMG